MQGLPCCGHTKPSSTLHTPAFRLQPSFATELPSSHCSSGVRTPLPQPSGKQAEPGDGQTQLASTWHVALHPSSVVEVLPSSQSSPASIDPSPQTGIVTLWQDALPGLPQMKLASTVRQSAEQPSPLSLLASSHTSSPVTWLSPQTTVLMQAMLITEQSYSGSRTKQSAEQPSPYRSLPSSQASEASITPSPHLIVDMHSPPPGGQTE